MRREGGRRETGGEPVKDRIVNRYWSNLETLNKHLNIRILDFIVKFFCGMPNFMQRKDYFSIEYCVFSTTLKIKLVGSLSWLVVVIVVVR
jgi:hypothetical protein